MNPGKDNNERLGQTLKEDVLHGDIWKTLRMDFRELKDFYIDEDKKQRLEKMGLIKRTLYLFWWYIKILLLRLSPTRRVILIIGIFLLLASGNIQWQAGSIRTSPETYLFGGALIVFVLMLELKDKLLARSELQAGRSVQYALMPPESPHINGWDVWLYSEPANDVGGDLVDYVKLEDNRHAFALGDVAGKGLRAALIMAKLQASIRALIPGYQNLVDLMLRLNAIFIRDSLKSIFASLVYMELDSNKQIISAVNAGHMPMLLVKKNIASVEHICSPGPALGVVSDAKYNRVKVRLEPGDTLIAYSDGIPDARNINGAFFGDERLLTTVTGSAHLSSEQIGKKLTDRVASFREDARIYDDISLIIIKRL